jgi:hypothetical protein
LSSKKLNRKNTQFLYNGVTVCQRLTILAPKLSAKLKEAVLKGTDSLYSINYSDLT